MTQILRLGEPVRKNIDTLAQESQGALAKCRFLSLLKALNNLIKASRRRVVVLSIFSA